MPRICFGVASIWGGLMTSTKRFVVAAAALTLLGGCIGMEVGAAKRVDPKGSDFDKALYAGYLELAEAELAEGDHFDSDRFALRATAAAAGEAPAPEEIAARELPADKTADLAAARERLTAALAAGARNKVPGEAARAQVMFDCWMQEQEENFQPDDIARCRGAFVAVLVSLEDALKPAVGPGLFQVSFEFDSARIGADGHEIIDRIATAAKALGAVRVKLAAHADRAGTDAYNQRLSEMRARAVVKALAGRGVPAVRIDARSFGERRPVVPTADGVSDSRNRVVLVTLEE